MGGVVSAIGNVVSGVGNAVGSILGGGSSGGGAASSDAQAAGLQANAAATTDIAKIQADTAQKYLDFQKEQYADLKPLADKLSQAQLDTMKQQSDIATSNEARAKEYADYDKSTFRPLEQGIVNDANNYNTTGKQEELASKGMADVATTYDSQKKQALDTLASYGINPNSNRFAAINMQLANSEAGAKAGAASNARDNAEQLGYARKLDAASLGRNLASNASTAYGVALNAGNSSVNSGNSAYTSAAAPGASYGVSMATGSNMLGNASNSYYGAGSLYGTGYKATTAASAQSSAGLGALTGQLLSSGVGQSALSSAGTAIMSMFADGGKVHKGSGRVRGIGGPVDDMIDAKLSNGEYVLPADTVKAIGIKKLDKMVKNTHTPAAVQRRQAIGG